jgi:hypothetical protein
MRRPRSLALARLALATLTAATAVAGGAAAGAQGDDAPAGTAVSVSGTSTLVDQLDPGVTTIEDGVVRTRGAVLVTVEESSDPRVSGRATISLAVDAYPDEDGTPGLAQIRYGEMRLENEEGAWEGWFAGRLNDSGFLQTYWLAGQGAYEGLSYVVTAGGNGNVWQSQGLIYPGELPPVGSVNRLPVENPGRDLPTA